jgi:hypothetical protein
MCRCTQLNAYGPETSPGAGSGWGLVAHSYFTPFVIPALGGRVGAPTIASKKHLSEHGLVIND